MPWAISSEKGRDRGPSLVAYFSPVTTPIGRFFGAGGGAIN
jgi:hypothetical protein